MLRSTAQDLCLPEGKLMAPKPFRKRQTSFSFKSLGKQHAGNSSYGSGLCTGFSGHGRPGQGIDQERSPGVHLGIGNSRRSATVEVVRSHAVHRAQTAAGTQVPQALDAHDGAWHYRADLRQPLTPEARSHSTDLSGAVHATCRFSQINLFISIFYLVKEIWFLDKGCAWLCQGGPCSKNPSTQRRNALSAAVFKRAEGRTR